MGRGAIITNRAAGRARTHEDMINSSVSEGALNAQRIEIRKHHEAGFDRNRDISYEGVKQHLSLTTCALSKEQGTRLIDALRQDLLRRGEKDLTPQQLAILRRYQRGMVEPERFKPNAPKRGGITVTMLRDIKPALGKLNVRRRAAGVKPYPKSFLEYMFNDLVICWMTGLRSCQMKELRVRDLVRNSEGEWECSTKRAHDPHAKKKGEPKRRTYKIINSVGWATKVLDARLKHARKKGEDAHVCPVWEKNHTLYSKEIKAIAGCLNWQIKYGVKIVGVHCLRHGSGNYVASHSGELAASDFLGHAYTLPALSVTRGYTASNSVKAGKAGRGATGTVHQEVAQKIARRTTKKVPPKKRAKKPVKKNSKKASKKALNRK
jgi:integrase